MRSVKLVALIALVASAMVYADSRIVYSVKTGGNNQYATYEAGGEPAFTNTSTGVTTVTRGATNNNLTWQVGVTVGSETHVGEPGNGISPIGAANLVFDLEVRDAGGNLVDIGAATLTCTSGSASATTPGVNCVPSTAGFWSQINDGDNDGGRINTFANAALARGIGNGAPVNNRNLVDAAAALVSQSDPGTGGPGFDYGWYPTAKGRGGIDFAGQKAIDTASTAVNSTTLKGKLVGFGAGYKSYNYASYRPGVGMGLFNIGFGAGNDDNPLNPVAPERPLFEGQICCKDLPVGTYTLRVVPSQDGNNILHGAVVYDATTPDYGGFGTFAAKANFTGGVVGGAYTAYAEVPFYVGPGEVITGIQGRRVFYNLSKYDGNRAAIDTGIISGTNNDDSDAIDTSKSPLLPGGGSATFANWTGFAQGINGLIYDVVNPSRAPLASDFTFENIGKWGTAAPTAVAHNAFFAFVQSAGPPQVYRCVFTFASVGGATPTATIRNTWIRVTIGTGFGLTAADVHYWGNAFGDTGLGNTYPNVLVSPVDMTGVRSNPVAPPTVALIGNPYDINKDGLVSPVDQTLIRNNPMGPSNVRMIQR